MYSKVMLALLVVMAGVITMQLSRLHPATKSAGAEPPAAAAESAGPSRKIESSVLQRRIPELNLKAATAEQAVDAIRQAGGVEIACHWNWRFPFAERVSLHLRNATIETALEVIKGQTGESIYWEECNGVLLLSHNGIGWGSVTRFYDVEDLLVPPGSQSGATFEAAQQALNQRRDALLIVIKENVYRETWQGQSGPSGLSVYDNILVVLHTPRYQDEVARFLAGLHRARAGGAAASQPAPKG